MGARNLSPLATGLRVLRSLGWLARREWHPSHSSLPPFAYHLLSVTTLQAYRKPFLGWHLSRLIRQYCPRKLIGLLKSGMGQGLCVPAVHSHTRPSLLSVGIRRPDGCSRSHSMLALPKLSLMSADSRPRAMWSNLRAWNIFSCRQRRSGACQRRLRNPTRGRGPRGRKCPHCRVLGSH